VAELLAGKGIDMHVTFKKAPKVRNEGAETLALPLERRKPNSEATLIHYQSSLRNYLLHRHRLRLCVPVVC